MTNEDLKEVDKNNLIDEILSIMFEYLIRENDKKDKVIKNIINEGKK